MLTAFNTTKEFATKLDEQDPIKSFKEGFYTPQKGIYMDGNSLGLFSKAAEASLLQAIEDYKTLGINGWMEGTPPWYTLAEELGKKQAPLVGAEEDEVIVHGSTTINLHLMLATFFKPSVNKNKIIIDELNFPSDKYAIESHLELHGLSPKEHLIIVKSRDGSMIEEDDIIAAMQEDVALILLPSVLYRSGQLLDIELLTREAHKKAIIIGFDCCHSVGAVPHQFSKWGVDFAFWCNYKYMNNGPGGTASMYINRRHFDRGPGLRGWWGYQKDKQFDMSLDFIGAVNAGAWQIGTINLFSTAPLEGSLKVFHEAGIENIRKKSLLQTEYMMFLINNILTGAPYNFSIGTPKESHRRGGHVALEHPTEAVRINEALKQRGVIPDFRFPNIIRLAPVALYNTFEDIWQVVQHLKEIIDNSEYESFTTNRGTVA